MRTPFVVANWKMQKTVAETLAFAAELAPLLETGRSVQAAIAPPFTALAALGPALAGTGVELAAQNLHPEPQGAFTGEISAGMLAELGCGYVIVGHSERRHGMGESSEFVARKLCAAQAAGLVPILCVGERLEEREAGRTRDVIASQLDASLEGAGPELVVAYEPVWAIGTGRTATPELAQEVHAFIRERLGKRLGDASPRIRIQYGGSVKPDNAAALLSQPDIDGALVGGASLEAASFAAILAAA